MAVAKAIFFDHQFGESDSPATVELSLTCGGHLRIDVTAPFYNSPQPNDATVRLGCPNIPQFGIWNHEVSGIHQNC